MIRSLAFLALLSAFMAVPTGCGTAGGQALGKCELGQLPQSSQATISDVTAIAMAGGSNWQDQLEGLGAALLPGQLECAIAAVAAAWATSHGELTPARAAALQRLHQYLAAHPARACAQTPVTPRG
jgi:hypothetical protein